VLACPSNVAAELVAEWPDAASDLAAIPLVSVAFVTLVFAAGTLGLSPELSGFVVPRNDQSLRITACSYASSKWPHWGGDVEMVRVSVGHTLDQATPELPDDQLLELVLDDLATATGVAATPVASRVTRWPAAFPQYEVGHIERLAHVEGELNPDGVFLAGMAYRGVGIPASIDSGRSAAVDALLHLLGD
jgi:oxygen-dependent protoporphyrinogen oxidase